jgi:uncharacterized protein YecE (DUF72 family)
MEKTRFLVGTSGWTYDHWKNLFYPEKLPRKAWLEYYSSQFSTVEINATFYGWFKDQTYINWRNRTPPGFRFVLKAPRLITHRKFLVDVTLDIQKFWASASLLGEKFSMVLLQIAPGMSYDVDLLHKALVEFPDPHKVAVEFRNDQWLNPEVFSMLKDTGACLCNPDSPRNRLTGNLTSRIGYIRLHGRKHWYSYNYSDSELQEMAILGLNLTSQGAEEIFFFFNNDFNGYAPRNATTLYKFLTDFDE